MSDSYESNSLEFKERAAFQQKHDAWRKYTCARDRVGLAREEVNSACQEYYFAKENLNHEYDELRKADECYCEARDRYERLCDCNYSLMEPLRDEANYQHQEMIRCLEQAKSERECGNDLSASAYTNGSNVHKARRDELNVEVNALMREICDAKDDVERLLLKTDASALNKAAEVLERAKLRYESARSKLKYFEIERDRLKEEFGLAQAEHIALKKKCEEVKLQKFEIEERD